MARSRSHQIRQLYRPARQSCGATYDVSLDGKRFLLIKDAGDSSQPVEPTSIVVVRNWFEELKQFVPPARR